MSNSNLFMGSSPKKNYIPIIEKIFKIFKRLFQKSRHHKTQAALLGAARKN